jgi:hypothetical protein
MNRVKKFLKAKGVKLEADYPYLPYDNGLEAVIVDSEKVAVCECYTMGSFVTMYGRNGKPEMIDNEVCYE